MGRKAHPPPDIAVREGGHRPSWNAEVFGVTPFGHYLAQPRKAEQFLQSFIQINELQLRVSSFGRHIQTDDCAQPGAVQVVHIRQIKHHSLAAEKQRLDRRFERFRRVGSNPAGAADYALCGFGFPVSP